LIGGLTSFVSTWSDTTITAYVPEAASLGLVPVAVITAAGTSNEASLDVTARQANDPLKWRFQMDAMYAVPRPAIGPDGTIYAVDVFNHLYALAPDGGLRWLVNGAGNKGVDVGADGTVYTGSEDSISAYNPDGTLKWSFVQNPRAFILLGPNVGPDGNIYAVATQGLGVLSLTPQGELRCNAFEAYARPIVDYQEVVFGMNGSSLQNYFAANNHFKGSKSDCTTVFANTNSSRLQPAVGPDNTVYVGGMRYDPNGNLINSAVFDGPINSVSPAAVGSDGIVYVIQNQTLLHVMNADLTERFSTNIGSLLTAPRVDPLNRMLVLGGADNYGMSGYIQATSVENGGLLWRIQLVDENGNYNAVMSPARFTPDGSTAYLTTYMFGPNQDVDPYSYVYALATGAAAGPSLSSLTLNPTSVSGGSTSQGTVTLTGAAPSGGSVVTLASSNTTVATVPSSVTIPAGATSATFVVTTYSVAAPTSVTISASYGGVSKTATLTVTPPSADTVTINLAQYWISKTQLRVNANSTSATATLEVYVTATDQFIGTLTNNGGKYSGKFFWPSNPQNITVRSSLGGSASKAVTVK
jgi:hypothetical protein